MKYGFRKTALIWLMAVGTAAMLGLAGWAQQTPYRVTLRDAIQQGLRANLNVLLAGAC